MRVPDQYRLAGQPDVIAWLVEQVLARDSHGGWYYSGPSEDAFRPDFPRGIEALLIDYGWWNEEHRLAGQKGDL